MNWTVVSSLSNFTVFQRTLAGRVTVSGTGLHSGNSCEVVLSPAEPDSGIVFVDGGERVCGVVGNVIGTARGTTLGKNGSRFLTVEHLMAALSGLGVDNCYVEVHGAEMPALDGSSRSYVEAILSVGIVDQDKRRNYLELSEPVFVKNGDSFILAVPSDKLEITYVLKYDHPIIGRQSSSFEIDADSFKNDIAPARTFVMYEEIAGLIDQHLARGGSLDNAIVVWQDRTSSVLRFEDELARHKLLDLVGDIALVGGHLKAEIVAVKSGHAMNVEFAKAVAAQIHNSKEKEAA